MLITSAPSRCQPARKTFVCGLSSRKRDQVMAQRSSSLSSCRFCSMDRVLRFPLGERLPCRGYAVSAAEGLSFSVQPKTLVEVLDGGGNPLWAVSIRRGAALQCELSPVTPPVQFAPFRCPAGNARIVLRADAEVLDQHVALRQQLDQMLLFCLVMSMATALCCGWHRIKGTFRPLPSAS